MSESAEDRSKRGFIKYLTEYEWSHQIAIFYQRKEDSYKAFDDSQRIREFLRRKLKDHSFLWRLRLGRVEKTWLNDVDLPEGVRPSKTVVLPYHTIFTNKAIDSLEDFEDSLEAYLPDIGLYAYKKRIDHAIIDKYAASVKKGAPDELGKYLTTDKRIRRFSSPIGRKNLLPRWTPDSDPELYPEVDWLEARMYFHEMEKIVKEADKGFGV